ncbi:hypothetical protein ASG52_05400 [Methylobacterium sp. Leaf456]|uniref:hypothetical protein n=1 Tax=Methylobacterium sp. Leaf456 TaxID=1736382 RepID=UPI0006F55358|nr:hypothetical protein [Methylobacterium sp. Leaf456]KQT53552.1 hypothetical protein ASG52_05400 [Methylobacterium sp. Leaf456]
MPTFTFKAARHAPDGSFGPAILERPVEARDLRAAVDIVKAANFDMASVGADVIFLEGLGGLPLWSTAARQPD